MISTFPEDSHCPKTVALKALDVLTAIKNQGFEPKALIRRLGWGKLTIYKSSLGTRKLKLDDLEDIVFSNSVIYRRAKSHSIGDWYVLKVWHRLNDDGLRLHTYAVGDCGSVQLVDLHEV